MLEEDKKFEKYCWELLKKYWNKPDEIILAQPDASSVSHYALKYFPLIPIRLPDNFFEYIKKRAIKNKGNGSWAHIPDFCVVKKENISGVRINQKEWVKFEKTEDLEQYFNKNNFLTEIYEWWFVNDEQELDWDSIKESNHIISLKSGKSVSKVIDAKNYDTNQTITSTDIEKLKYDALMFGADECYVITYDDVNCPSFTEVANLEGVYGIYKRKVKAYILKDYIKPEFITLDEFNRSYNSIIRQLGITLKGL